MAARRRVFRDRDPILERLHDTELQAVYRFNRLGIDYLVRRLGPHIQHKTRRNKALSPVEMILVTLRFLATGSMQKVSYISLYHASKIALSN